MLDDMVFTATFNNISVISWWSVLLVEETEYSEKTTDLPIQYVIKRTASISYIANYPCISKQLTEVHKVRVMVMMLNATCNTISVISWRSVLLVKEKYKYV
jgi:hypothetical protein